MGAVVTVGVGVDVSVGVGVVCLPSVLQSVNRASKVRARKLWSRVMVNTIARSIPLESGRLIILDTAVKKKAGS
jgi:hypothetical protein